MRACWAWDVLALRFGAGRRHPASGDFISLIRFPEPVKGRAVAVPTARRAYLRSKRMPPVPSGTGTGGSGA
ncbi:hypothetical protein JCM14713_07640 [Desulfomicrobium salsuginis]